MSRRSPADGYATCGYVRVVMENGDRHFLAVGESERLDTALDAGATWYRGTTAYDMPLRFRLDEVTSVEEVTPAVRAQERAFFAAINPDGERDVWQQDGD